MANKETGAYLQSRKVIPGNSNKGTNIHLERTFSALSLPLWSAVHFKGFSPERALAGALSSFWAAQC